MWAPATSNGDVEVEWQLDALDLRPVQRWFDSRFGAGGEGERVAGDFPAGLNAVARPAKRLVDTYLDTEDWRIVRSGYVLRTRRRGGVLEATMKSLAPAADGLRERTEVTEAIVGAGVDEMDPQGPVGRRVKALVANRRLREVLEVRTHRRLFALVIHDEQVGEVALDGTTIVLPGDPHRLRLQRVEVEVLGSWVDSLQPFVEQLRSDCGLQPATLSKFEAGLMAAGLPIPGRGGAPTPVVGPDSTIGELAYAVTTRDLQTMRRNEPGTRLGEDPEALHQMRVATRRLRAALALFADALPARATRLRTEIGWLAGVLGGVRDLDVQLENLEQWCEELPGEHGQALDHLRDLLTSHRHEARSALLEALESRRYERLVASLGSMLEQGPAKRSPSVAVPAVIALPDLVRGRHRAALSAARRAESSGELPDFHRLRIRCKRLRYALEFTAGLYPQDVKRFARRVAVLQDHLGLIQDAEVAYDRLRQIAVSGESGELTETTVFAMGMVAQRCREEAAVRLKALSRPSEALKSQRWHDAWSVLDKAREAASSRMVRPLEVTRPAVVKKVARVPRPAADRRPAGAISEIRRRSEAAAQPAGDSSPKIEEGSLHAKEG